MLTAGPIRVRSRRRSLGVTALVVLVAVALAMAGLLIGDYGVGVFDVGAALAGTHPDPLAEYFVRDIRFPRVLVAALVGAALGVSGGIFQTISHNPLGSPDIIGFTTGAATGALVQIIVFEAGPGEVALGALIGGFVTAAIVYLLAWRSGLQGYRLVLVGIGIGAVLSGVNSLLVVRASLTAAQTAAQWLAGSLNARTWGDVAVIGIACLVFVPAALALSRPLSLMTLGDDVSTGLGVRTERTRLSLLIIGVTLVAFATAVTGPIAFVALAAPQLAKRLTGAPAIGLASAAFMGAALVLASDLIAQRLFAPTQLPVGVVSGSLGGVYLIWLLTAEWRKKAA